MGKTSTRGHKGQRSRSGSRSMRGFEGGQMPLHRRLPKRGFRNTPFAIKLNEINLGDVQEAIDAGTLKIEGTLDVAGMIKAGLLSKPRDGVKLLGNGELKAKVDFAVWRASQSAIATVEKAGGSVKILAPAKEEDAEPRGKNKRAAMAGAKSGAKSGNSGGNKPQQKPAKAGKAEGGEAKAE
jgi:large subunit ribosomal protein L15